MTVDAIPIGREPSRFVDVARVLEDAEDPSLPLPDRLRFLANAGTALEDALRVQAAVIAAMRKTGKGKRALGRVEAARYEVLLLQERLGEIWCGSIRRRLERLGLRFVGRRDLDTFGRSWTRTYFEQEVVDRVRALVIDAPGTLEQVDDGCYLAVRPLAAPGDCTTVSAYPLALVSIPPSLPPRVTAMPDVGYGRSLIWLDDVIRTNMGRLVPDFAPGEAHAVRPVTLGEADLDRIPGRKAQNVLGRLLDESGGSCRFLEYDCSTPYPVIAAIRDGMGLDEDRLLAVGRYPGFGGVAALADVVDEGVAPRAAAVG